MANEKRKIRKNIMIGPSLHGFVKETAGKYKISESRVIEKALVNFQSEEKRAPLPAFFDFAGAFDCEHADLSTSYKKLKSRRSK